MNLKSDRGCETSVLLPEQYHSHRSLTFSFLNVILWLSFIKAATKKIQEHHLEAPVLLPDNLPAELPLIFPMYHMILHGPAHYNDVVQVARNP